MMLIAFAISSFLGLSVLGVNDTTWNLIKHSAAIKSANGSSVLLLPSSGCYSHDAMMKQVGESFGTEQSIFWLQILMYDFSKPALTFPHNWTPLVLNKTNAHNQEMIANGISLFWEQSIPVDLNRPWDMRGALYFFRILENNRKYCLELQQSKQYKYLLESSDQFDLIVLDHFLQECITVLLSKMNKTTIQFSNWPLSDGYIASMNIPAMPSAVPKTGSLFSGNGMNFWERILNLLYQFFITATRTIQALSMKIYFNSDIFQIEARHLIYAGRSEMLTEPIRPINNRIKFFGSNDDNTKQFYQASLQVEIIEHKFKAINWAEIENNKFVLVTFGSISNIHDMPRQLLKILLEEFGKKPYLILWQSNTAQADVAGMSGIQIPRNVRILKWAPIKLLLVHPSLKFVVCHGGINTVNELVSLQVPFIGIPLQGDQNSNLQRLVDLRVIKLLSIREVWDGKLGETINDFENSFESYKARAIKIGSMVAFHKTLSPSQQMWWVKWSRKYGPKILNKKGKHFFDMKMKTTSETYMLEDLFLSLSGIILLSAFLSKL